MKISEFAVVVAVKEGKKRQVNIAQIKEVLSVINRLVKGALYKAIKEL